MRRIYFDYAASTPVDPAVVKAMTLYFSRKFGNPGSLHFFGQEAMAAIDESREKIAGLISADFREIIFTGSATEANNLALRGIIEAAFGAGKLLLKTAGAKITESPPRIIISEIEHESILETARDLEKQGVEVIYLPVNREGVVDLKKLKEYLNSRTVLVSIMYANNETGAIQPIKEISRLIAEFRNQKMRNISDQNSRFYFPDSNFPRFHTDAVQAFQFLDCGAGNPGVDLMTLSAHKIYGPKGIGALYAADKIRPLVAGAGESTLSFKSRALSPVITGGGQEFGLRSGTENVPAIVGFAKAAELAVSSRKTEGARIAKLKNYFWKKLKKNYPKAELNGSPANCLPNIANIYFPNYQSSDFLVKLDLAGVAVSSGAACSARSAKPSYVLAACGFSEKRIKSSLRFSFGRFTAKAEIDEVIKRIKRIFNKS